MKGGDDVTEFEQIYREHFDTVYRFLIRLCRNEPLAEELAQETFFRAMRSLGKFDGRCRVDVWLCQIAKNLWYDECRKNKKLKNISEEELFNIEEKSTIEENIVSGEEKIEIYKKMQKLDEKTREVMYLRISGELSFKEIGIILNKTENWARVTFYRGKNKLKEVD